MNVQPFENAKKEVWIRLALLMVKMVTLEHLFILCLLWCIFKAHLENRSLLLDVNHNQCGFTISVLPHFKVNSNSSILVIKLHF